MLGSVWVGWQELNPGEGPVEVSEVNGEVCVPPLPENRLGDWCEEFKYGIVLEEYDEFPVSMP